jgi:hypothetical protein
MHVNYPIFIRWFWCVRPSSHSVMQYIVEQYKHIRRIPQAPDSELRKGGTRHQECIGTWLYEANNAYIPQAIRCLPTRSSPRVSEKLGR